MIIPSDLIASKGYVDMAKALEHRCVYIHDSRNIEDLDLGMLEYRFIVAPSTQKSDYQTIMAWQCNANGKIGWKNDSLRGVVPESMRKLKKVEKETLILLCNGRISFKYHEEMMSLFYKTK